MTPEREDKLRRILRLATLLSTDELPEYISAITNGDDEMRQWVEANLPDEANFDQTFFEWPKGRPPFMDHPLKSRHGNRGVTSDQ